MLENKYKYSSSPWSRGSVLKMFSGRRGWFPIFFLTVLLAPNLLEAQCAMCRAALESEANGNTAEGINNGIVYLMAIPYILVGGLFYFVYRKLRK